jgi:hypothetical protein
MPINRFWRHSDLIEGRREARLESMTERYLPQRL